MDQLLVDVSEPERWQVPQPLRRVGMASWLTIGVAVVAVGVLALLAVARTITIPLILGTMFGMAAFPLTDWSERRLHRRALAALVVTAVALVVVALVAFVVVDQVVGQAQTIGNNLEASAQKAKEAAGSNSGVTDAIARVENSVRDNWQRLLKGAALLAGGAVNSVAALFLSVFLSFNVFFLIQKDGRTLKRWAARHLLLPPPLATSILGDAVRAVRGYFVGTSIVALQNAVVVFIAALALGTPIPFVIAVVVFLFAFVPFIGAIVGGAFAVLMAYAGGGTTRRPHHAGRRVPGQRRAADGRPADRSGHHTEPAPAGGARGDDAGQHHRGADRRRDLGPPHCHRGHGRGAHSCLGHLRPRRDAPGRTAVTRCGRLAAGFARSGRPVHTAASLGGASPLLEVPDRGPARWVTRMYTLTRNTQAGKIRMTQEACVKTNSKTSATT